MGPAHFELLIAEMLSRVRHAAAVIVGTSSLALCDGDIDGVRRHLRTKATGLDQRLAIIEQRVRARREGREPIRVLVTGFCDWKGLQGDLWRVRENPSGRLLVGTPQTTANASCDNADGELPRRLRALRDVAAPTRPIEWTFRLKPVVWDFPDLEASPTPFCAECLHYDYVVHLGLGVYDRKDTILVERGAVNAMRGTDVRGVTRGIDGYADDSVSSAQANASAKSADDTTCVVPPGSLIDRHFGHVLLPPANSTFMAGAMARVSGEGGKVGNALSLPRGFVARVAEARDTNVYLCNQVIQPRIRVCACLYRSVSPCLPT